MTAPRVFVGYSHDSPEHAQAVLALSDRLRADGIDAIVDQYVSGAPSEGWPRWVEEQIQGADAVLLVCSQGFERLAFDEEGRGVRWEGSLIFQELYSDRLAPTRFIPVVLAKSDIKFITAALRAYTFYLLDTDRNRRSPSAPDQPARGGPARTGHCSESASTANSESARDCRFPLSLFRRQACCQGPLRPAQLRPRKTLA